MAHTPGEDDERLDKSRSHRRCAKPYLLSLPQSPSVLTVVIPTFNEAANVPVLVERISSVLDAG